jgi:hypothetical protein
LQFAINHTLHSSTNKSPSEVCLGFLPQSPFDLEFTIESTSQLEKGEGDRIRAQRFVDQIRKIHHEVEQQLQKAQQKYKECHDRHRIQSNFKKVTLFGCIWARIGCGEKVKNSSQSGMDPSKLFARLEIMHVNWSYQLIWKCTS